MRKLANGALAFILIWSLCGSLNPAGLLDGKIASSLDELIGSLGSTSVPLIVQTHGAPSATDTLLVQLLGGKAGKPFSSVAAFPALLPANKISSLLGSSRVRRVSYDWRVRSFMDSATPYSGAPDAWRDYGLTGDGVGVAFIDSGVNESADLNPAGGARRVVHVDMLSDPITGLLLNLLDPKQKDGYGHGTHVAGIIGGSGAASSGTGAFRTFRGMAPLADLIALRALDGTGSGSTSNILRAIDWVIANKSAYKIRVLNLSLGHPVDESYRDDPLCQALEAAWRAGIVVVVSAGNQGADGYSSILSPGNDPYVITVGASADRNTISYDDDGVSSFSSMGPTTLDGIIKPDLLASGVQIISTRAAGSTIDNAYPTTRVPYSFYLSGGSSLPSSYAAYSGTSMSAPVVAGAAALMLQREPGLSPDTVKTRLMKSAHAMDADVVRTGAGLLDVAAALARSEVRPAMSAQSPRVSSTTTADGAESISVLDPAELYLNPLDPDLDGQIALWGNRSQWGQIAIWGRTNSAQIAIWGRRAQTGGAVVTASK